MILLKIILFVLLGYYVLKWLAKWLAPIVLRYAIKKVQQRFGSQFTNYQNTRDPSHEVGKTAIVKKPVRKSKASKNVGEYIDFEELDR